MSLRESRVKMGGRTCCRCGIIIAEQHRDVLGDVCDPCLKELISSGAGELAELLESHHLPAALIGADMTVLAFNSGFEQIFRGDHELLGMRVGAVLDCFHPTPEMPCGETYLCPHCGIRRLIQATQVSGESISQIAMSFRHKSGLDQTYIFSAYRIGEAILLSVGA
jgi:hypothetical protein